MPLRDAMELRTDFRVTINFLYKIRSRFVNENQDVFGFFPWTRRGEVSPSYVAGWEASNFFVLPLTVKQARPLSANGKVEQQVGGL